MNRHLAVVLAVLAVLGIAGGALYLLTSLDAIVARKIEHHGSRLVGTQVDVDGVEIDLATATGTIRGLRVANPEGFSRDAAIEFEEITLEIDASSLRSSPLRLPRVEVGRTDVRFEVDALGESNIGVLRRNVQNAPTAPAEEGEALRLRIDRLVFDGGEIVTHVASTDRADRNVALPALSLAHLGGRDGGTPAEIGQQVLLDLTRRVVVAVAGSELRDAVKREVGGLLDRILE
jgi:hypothetical protein